MNGYALRLGRRPPTANTAHWAVSSLLGSDRVVTSGRAPKVSRSQGVNVAVWFTPTMVSKSLVFYALLPLACAQSISKAIKDNNAAMVNIVMKSGVAGGINAPLKDEGEPPLLLAVRLGKHKALKALFKNPKLDVDIADKDGLPVFHVAAASGSLKVVTEMLTTKKFDPLHVHEDGLAPLHRAVLSGSTDVVKALLNADVPVDQPTAETPEIRVPMDMATDGAMREVLKKFARTKSEL